MDWLIGTSSYSLALIALDRLFFITKPLVYKAYVTRKKALLVVLITWTFTAGLSIIVNLTQNITSHNYEKVPYCLAITIKTNLGTVLVIFLLLLVPLVVITITYIMIFIKVGQFLRSEMYKNAKRNRELYEEPNYQDNSERTVTCIDTSGLLRASKTLTYSIIFACVSLPYIIANFIYIFVTPEKDIFTFKSKVLDKLAMSSFSSLIINPLLYGWWHKGFRKAIKDIWKSYQKKNQHPSVLKNKLIVDTRKQVHATNSNKMYTVDRNESTLMTTKDLVKTQSEKWQKAGIIKDLSIIGSTEQMRKR